MNCSDKKKLFFMKCSLYKLISYMYHIHSSSVVFTVWHHVAADKSFNFFRFWGDSSSITNFHSIHHTYINSQYLIYIEDTGLLNLFFHYHFLCRKYPFIMICFLSPKWDLGLQTFKKPLKNYSLQQFLIGFNKGLVVPNI